MATASRKGYEPIVIKEGDGTADDVVRANVGYVPGAESVQIQIKTWDEIKAYHVKNIEISADQIANVMNVFMSKLHVNYVPTGCYMETYESYIAKKEGRAGSNAYNGATGVSKNDEIHKLQLKIQELFANGEPMEEIAMYQAKCTELIEEEVEKINALKEEEA